MTSREESESNLEMDRARRQKNTPHQLRKTQMLPQVGERLRELSALKVMTPRAASTALALRCWRSRR